MQPEGPHNPFAYSVLGVAVVHLLVQALLFGLAAVLLDVGLLRLLRAASLWLMDMLRPPKKLPGHRRGVSAGAAAGPQAEPQSGAVQQQQPPAQQHLLHPACDGVVDGKAAVADEAGEAVITASCSSVLTYTAAQEDADVAAERLAVQAGQGIQGAMVSKGCTLQYSSHQKAGCARDT